MKRCPVTFLLSVCVFLLSGYGHLHSTSNTVANNNLSTLFIQKVNNKEIQFLDNVSSNDLKELRKKFFVLENEENEEEFTSTHEQLLKSNRFLDFINYNCEEFCFDSTAKKLKDFDYFSFQFHKVYLLFQVFRI